jgi:tetratricopeptide (TPR) repeat protein
MDDQEFPVAPHRYHGPLPTPPVSLQIQNNYATFLSASGAHAEALKHYEKVVGEEPDSTWVRRNPWLLTNLSNIYVLNRQFDKAFHAARRAVEISPRHPRALLALARVYIATGRTDSARAVFDRADKANEQYASYRALLYAAMGNADSTFIWFDRVKDWGIPVMISLQSSEEVARFRGDPRFPALLARLGIPGR